MLMSPSPVVTSQSASTRLPRRAVTSTDPSLVSSLQAAEHAVDRRCCRRPCSSARCRRCLARWIDPSAVRTVSAPVTSSTRTLPSSVSRSTLPVRPRIVIEPSPLRALTAVCSGTDTTRLAPGLRRNPVVAIGDGFDRLDGDACCRPARPAARSCRRRPGRARTSRPRRAPRSDPSRAPRSTRRRWSASPGPGPVTAKRFSSRTL